MVGSGFGVEPAPSRIVASGKRLMEIIFGRDKGKVKMIKEMGGVSRESGLEGWGDGLAVWWGGG